MIPVKDENNNKMPLVLQEEICSRGERMRRSETALQHCKVLADEEKATLKAVSLGLRHIPGSLETHLQSKENYVKALTEHHEKNKNVLEQEIAKLEKDLGEKGKSLNQGAAHTRRRKEEEYQKSKKNLVQKKADLERPAWNLERCKSERAKNPSIKLDLSSRDEVLDHFEKEIRENRFQTTRKELNEYLKETSPFVLNMTKPEKSKYTFSSKRMAEFSQRIPVGKSSYAKVLDSSKGNLTLDAGKYLDNRLSQQAVEMIKKHPQNTEFFLGDEQEMHQFYADNGFKYLLEYQGASSTRYFLFEDKDRAPCVVVQGFESEEKVFHRLLQLKASGLPVEEISIRGNLSHIDRGIERLSQQIKWPSKDVPRVVFIGNSRVTLNEVGYVANSSLSRSENLGGFKYLNVDHFSGILPFDVQAVHIPSSNGSKVAMNVGAMKMPNGSTAGKMVKMFLKDHKVDYIIMNGSGGSLDPQSKVSSYQQIKVSNLGSNSYDLYPKKEQVKFLDRSKNSYVTTITGVNQTVNSILEEDDTWFAAAKEKKVTNCDVETAHMFKAFLEFDEKVANHTPKIIPGLFISDEVGSVGLEKKISANTAYANIEPFVKSCLTLVADDNAPAQAVPAQRGSPPARQVANSASPRSFAQQASRSAPSPSRSSTQQGTRSAPSPSRAHAPSRRGGTSSNQGKSFYKTRTN